MARQSFSVLFALLFAGCTARNPDFGGVGLLDAAGTGGAAGSGGRGGAAGQGGAAGASESGGTGGGASGGAGGGGSGGAGEGGAGGADVAEEALEVAPVIEAGPELPAEPVCGTDRPSLAGMVETDGLAVALDGTIYYSTSDETHGYVGRLRPNRTLEHHWQRLDNQPITWGLALDTKNDKLYFASDTTIFGFDLAFDPPLRFPIGAKFTNINDLVVGPDSNLYVSVQSDRAIHRVLPTTAAASTRISMAALGTATQNDGPAALAFGADGALYIGMAGKSPIVKMLLDGGLMEKSRSSFGTFAGWANGLAFDRSGRLYVGLWDATIDNEINLLTPTGAPAGKVVVKGRFASMAFGRGALNCRDLYVANPLGNTVRVETDTPGLPAP